MTLWTSNTAPHELRTLMRRGVMRDRTGSLAAGFQQANIAILPMQWAENFQAYVEANHAACPLLAIGAPGDPSLPSLGSNIDIRFDLPRYRVLQGGVVTNDPFDVGDVWRADMVTFALGCSLGFEAVVIGAGAALRCHAPGQTCSAFVSAIETVEVGPFRGPLVVTMRAVRREDVDLVAAITAMHPETHGGPVHVGDPAAIGVDLSNPIEGIGLTDLREGEVAMFWPCGVTSHYALAKAAPPIAITHFPGHMLVTDLPAGELPTTA
ncbi:DUF1445 domain-containing protein [Devosia sp. 2618]|uniref:D-glutamate cyclase family protein n=1 Tax=Devosia sp. 2618 TaxID=3156454 RepID=UPI00339B47EF